jgi:hypothetical protein
MDSVLFDDRVRNVVETNSVILLNVIDMDVRDRLEVQAFANGVPERLGANGRFSQNSYYRRTTFGSFVNILIWNTVTASSSLIRA